MDNTFIAIILLLLLAILFILLFLFKSINKKSFKAQDWTVFENQSDLDLYQNLYEKTKPLFSVSDSKGSSSQSILGFDISFIAMLKTEGFQDLKTLVKYRKQIKSLSDLINN